MDETPIKFERAALVSGGSRGIGAGIAMGLSRRGCAVACTYRTGRDEAEALVASAPNPMVPIRYDLQDESSAAAAVSKTLEEFGRLDSLVLNAGLWAGGRLSDIPSDDWWDVVAANLKGTVALAREALPQLAHGTSPSIVLVSSVVGIIGHAGDTAYASAKAGMIGFARSLAKEVAPKGIRVNVLAPGFVETDMTDQVPAAARKNIESATVLRRFGTVDEMAKAAVFLSEDATFSTGSVLTVDGGWSL